MASPRCTPEQSLVQHERVVIAKRVLTEMKPHEREILRRSYLDEQPPEQICNSMGLSMTQLRLLKSRAKARFGELGRQQLQPKPPATTLQRLSRSPRCA
jgi:DNA-directed RNA polymerase specialized sigma24 family protein